MERERMLERIAQARLLLREVIEATDLPMIERTLMLADMNLHWAQWNLAEPVSLMPEMESSPESGGEAGGTRNVPDRE